MLTFHNFDIMYGIVGCRDYLEISYSGTIQRLCNDQYGSPGPIPDPITTSATSMTVKLVTSHWLSDRQTGFLASVGPSVNVTTDVIGECAMNFTWSKIYHFVILSESWPACLHMSTPEGYFKSSDCHSQNFYVCQNNADFSSPPQGGDFI